MLFHKTVFVNIFLLTYILQSNEKRLKELGYDENGKIESCPY